MQAPNASVAPRGRPLSAAVLSVENLDRALEFHRDVLGYAPVAEPEALAPAFQVLFGLSSGVPGRAVLLRACEMAVGQLLLVEWDAAGRERIRPHADLRGYGLQNVNVYVADAHEAVADLVAAGCEPWSPPVPHELEPHVGALTEVVLEGPDGVALVVVELTTRDPATRIGHMRAYVEQCGYTPAGYTPVVTTLHVVRSVPQAVRFYAEVLGLGVLIDTTLASDAVNRLLKLPPGCRTHGVFLQGGDMYGKVAVAEPLGWRCEELASRARAPNLGYLAQLFEVEDLVAARLACARVGAPFVGSATAVDVPGYGQRAALCVQHPASGAPVVLLGPQQ